MRTVTTSDGVPLRVPELSDEHFIPRLLQGNVKLGDGLQHMADNPDSVEASLMLAAGVLTAQELTGCVAAILVVIATLRSEEGASSARHGA